jgi:hypothetical protein
VDYEDILRRTRSVVLHDWPDADVPDTLVRIGYTVTIHGGPAPEDIVCRELRDGRITERRTGAPPTHADLVYVFRPVEELAAIVRQAVAIGAMAVWCQSGLAPDGSRDPRGCWRPDDEAAEVRRIVESAGLTCITEPYIADAVRALS